MTQRTGRVEGKVAIVTGAGSTPGPGIGTGKAAAVVLAREGASVLLVDMHPERAEETLKMITDEGGTAKVFAADCTSSADCEAMVKAAVDEFGTVDILVNNIGLASLGTVVDLSEQAWDQALNVNLRTAFLASKHAVPVMAAKGSGAVVNISSISALRGDGTIAYSAAKAALIGMRSEAGLLGTPGTGWDVGWAVGFLASDEARWITGVVLPVESGVLSVTPLMMAPYLRAIPEPTA
jgi:NAD(P)-dependent dehydrogenase (short-subunit alcohol dehydrogenase family)